jgi:hypothetical protein
MRRLIAPALFLLLFLGCGSSDDPVPPAVAIPAAATGMDSQLATGMDTFMPRVVRFETILVFILNPGTPLAQGVTLTPDTSPGAPPHSFTFSGPYDGNDDGFNETTMSGRATFNSDPAVAWSGVTGQAAVNVAIPMIGHVYQANINFSITSANEQLSGSGTFTNPLTGTTTTMTVAAATPLVVKPATGAVDAVSNACGYSLMGPMRFEVTGSSGTLRSTWNFSSNSASVAVNNRSFTDSSGLTTMLPDSTVESRCGGGRTINDWVGSYDQFWACLPRETGRATITMSVAASNAVSITDEDPPGSGDLSTYTAMTIDGNAHALRGFFIAGPSGFRYREDFNWTMRKSLSGFAQSSRYVYIEGPNQGTGGFCVASAPRL